MNYLRIGFALLVVASAAYASSIGMSRETGTSFEYNDGNSLMRNDGSGLNALLPDNWLARLSQSVPSMDTISFRYLAQMPVPSAKTLLKAVVQKAYLEKYNGPLYRPNIDQTFMYLITGTGNVSVPLGNPGKLSGYPLNASEITIFISGMPSNSEDPRDAVTELVEAYRQRYDIQDHHVHQETGSWDGQCPGNLIVVDLGNKLNTFKKWATLDIEAVGKDVGRAIVNINKFAPDAYIHVIGNSVGAHVAGEAAKEFEKITNKQLPRVTGLDPINMICHSQKPGVGLNRGAAEFVDVIHSTSNEAGDATNGDADFYPNGRGSITAGARNFTEATLKSLRYFAESVRPGNEKNFMAIECTTMHEYESRECQGFRIPMGYSTPVNAKGDFILRVNPNAPYGRNGKHLMGGQHQKFRYHAFNQ